MSDADDISGLESALAERARKLSEEHLINGRQARELMLAEARQRLQVEEELINATFPKLVESLSALAADETRYLPLLRNYLCECAQAIERDELVAQFNARDLQRLQQGWAQYAAESAPGKRLTLSPDPLNSIGGVLVISADRDIRFDNTFEGRMERLAETLQGVIAERLMPQIGEAANG